MKKKTETKNQKQNDLYSSIRLYKDFYELILDGCYTRTLEGPKDYDFRLEDCGDSIINLWYENWEVLKEIFLEETFYQSWITNKTDLKGLTEAFGEKLIVEVRDRKLKSLGV